MTATRPTGNYDQPTLTSRNGISMALLGNLVLFIFGLTIWFPTLSINVADIYMQPLEIFSIILLPISLIIIIRLSKISIFFFLFLCISWIISIFYGGELLTIIYYFMTILPFGISLVVFGAYLEARRFFLLGFLSGTTISIALAACQLVFGARQFDFRTNENFGLASQFDRAFALLPEVSTLATFLIASMVCMIAGAAVDHHRRPLYRTALALAALTILPILYFLKSSAVLLILPLLASITLVRFWKFSALWAALTLAGAIIVALGLSYFFDHSYADRGLSAINSLSARASTLIGAVGPIAHGDIFGVGIGNNDEIFQYALDAARSFDLRFYRVPGGVTSLTLARIFEEGFPAVIYTAVATAVLFIVFLRRDRTRSRADIMILIIMVGFFLSSTLASGYRGLFSSWIWMFLPWAFLQPTVRGAVALATEPDIGRGATSDWHPAQQPAAAGSPAPELLLQNSEQNVIAEQMKKPRGSKPAGRGKKRILVFEPLAGGHRQQQILCLFAAARRAEKIDLVFLLHPDLISEVLGVHKAMTNAGPPPQMIPSHTAGSIVSDNNKDPVGAYRALKLAYEVAESERCELIHLMHLDTFMAALPAFLLFHRKTPFTGTYFRPTAHYEGPLSSPLSMKQKIWNLGKILIIDRLIADTMFRSILTMDEYYAAYVNSVKVVAIPDGYGTPETSSLPKDLPRSWKSAKYRVLCFGALDRRKGVVDLIEAAARIVNPKRTISVLLAGQIRAGQEEEVQQALDSARSRLSKRVSVFVIPRFLGEDEVAGLVAASSLIALPYRNHIGSSGVIGWAAAAGVPVVTQNWGLIGQLVRSHGLGTTTPPNAPERLAEIITSAALNGVKEFEASGATAYAARYSAKNFGLETLAALEKVV